VHPMRGVFYCLIKKRGLVLCLALASVAVLLPSCGKSRKVVYPVHGKILDNSDKPAFGATIVFHPVDSNDANVEKPIGNVGEDGTFSLTTYEKDDGAPEGEYVATIEWRPKGEGFGAPPGPDKLGGQLNNKATSKLRFKVQNLADNVLEPIKLP
jgi:hypothetical protein